MTLKTILIATNSIDTLKRFSEAFRKGGHQSLEANNEQNLLATLSNQSETLDLFLLDIRVSHNFAEIIKKAQQTAPNSTLAVFSGSVGNPDEIKTLAELGITSYINEHMPEEEVLQCLTPLLFPKSFDRRTSNRVTLSIPCALEIESTIVSGQILNIGKGGLAVRTMEPILIGSRITIVFRLPNHDREINSVSRVAWSNRQSVQGLQFEEIQTSDQAIIDEFVDSNS